MSNVNLIANGNFENGFTGWDASGNIVTKEANISLAAIFNGGDTVGNGILAQKFSTITPLSFQFRPNFHRFPAYG